MIRITLGRACCVPQLHNNPTKQRQRTLKHTMAMAVIGLLLVNLVGCGFQLRGRCPIPTAFQRLKICPNNRLDDFQRILRRNLKLNEVYIIDAGQTEPVNSLSIISQSFSERNIAYGSDAQVNRALLQFQVKYQMLDSNGKTLCPENTLRVERELVVNPNAVLGSETERHQVEEELYQDASIQLIRQLSAACTS